MKDKLPLALLRLSDGLSRDGDKHSFLVLRFLPLGISSKRKTWLDAGLNTPLLDHIRNHLNRRLP